MGWVVKGRGWGGWAGTERVGGVGWYNQDDGEKISSFNQDDGEKISSLNFENAQQRTNLVILQHLGNILQHHGMAGNGSPIT